MQSSLVPDYCHDKEDIAIFYNRREEILRNPWIPRPPGKEGFGGLKDSIVSFPKKNIVHQFKSLWMVRLSRTSLLVCESSICFFWVKDRWLLSFWFQVIIPIECWKCDWYSYGIQGEQDVSVWTQWRWGWLSIILSLQTRCSIGSVCRFRLKAAVV